MTLLRSTSLGVGMPNPALADFRSLDDVERQAAQARLVPSKESAFRNLILNQRVSAVSRFIHKAEWDRCNIAPELAALEGRECYGGLDLSGSRDLTAFVLVFPNDDRAVDVAAWRQCRAEYVRLECGHHSRSGREPQARQEQGDGPH